MYRLLFIDYCLDFKTIVHHRMVTIGLGLNRHLCTWIYKFLIGRLQVCRVCSVVNTITINTGAP